MNNTQMSKPIVLIGGGGHASVITDILKQQCREIIAIISPENIGIRKIFNGIAQLYKDNDIDQFDPEQVLLVNCIGVLPGSLTKKKINEQYLAKGYNFETIIANNAYVSPYAVLGTGVQILTGAIIHPGVFIDSHSVINSGAVIEHDAHIGSYNFIAPRAVICGQCRTENDVFIGANATVIQNITIAARNVITANSVVVKNTQPDKKINSYRLITK
ncbi:acetyltransferase [Pectobacterium polonicum]|uniref:acetyltransferase n=1 Tax=Pectobacterium polonicum TaxID=2485124 RepID=UPI003753FEB3